MNGLQGALFPPEASWRPPRLADVPQDWNDSPRLGIDTETCDPLLKKLGPGVRRGGYIAGVSFALTPDQGWYLPLRHLGGDNMEDPDQALAYLRWQAENYTGEVVGAKLDYDLDFLAEAGITFPRARAFKDVQVVEPLLDELQYTYGLDAILGRYGLPLKEEELLRQAAAEFRVDPKAELYKLPARYVGKYASADAARPLALLERQELEVEKQNLWRIWELEQAVTPVLVKMRRRGVRIDFDQLDRVERWAKAEELKAWGELHRLTGVSVKLGDGMKANVIARALNAADVWTPKTAQGKPSITKEWLEALDHPAGAVIRRARKMSQLCTTFVASIRAHAVNGRVHCTFNQVARSDDDDGDGVEGARYGRLSAVDPNLQQQPGDKDPEIGPMWRAVYIPDEGGKWGQLDYSQQEPRGAVHFAVAAGPKRIGAEAHRIACEMAKAYQDPTTDAHTLFTTMVYGEEAVAAMDKKTFKTTRSHMKNIFLGVCYGMGGAKLCHKLGLPTKVIENSRNGRRMEVAGDEGQALLDLVDRRAPYLRRTAKDIEQVAKDRGYIITAGGRRCRFPKDDHGNYDWTHKAFNRAIQGTAADQTKTAMVMLDREGVPLQLQVHDEFDLTIGSEAEGRRIQKVMEEALPLHVPSRVDFDMGDSWGAVTGE